MTDDMQRENARKALVDQARRASDAPHKPARGGKPNAGGDKSAFNGKSNKPASGGGKPFGKGKPAFKTDGQAGKSAHAPHGKPNNSHARDGKPAFSPDKRRPASAAPQTDGTPSRRAAHKALGLVTRDKAYAGLALDKVLSEERLSAQDKALATEIFYGTLEHIAKLDFLLGQLMTRSPEPAIQDVLRISAYQMLYLERIPESAVCDVAVKITRALGFESATGMVNGVLRNLARKREELKQPVREDGIEHFLSIEYSMPEFVCRRLVEQYGADEAERILAWKPQRFITVRPNALRISAAEFEARLDKLELRWERSRVPGAYRVFGMGAVDRNPLYRQGLFSVQGESSLMCAQVIAPKPGMQVLDACAAPGGKAAALAEMMQGSGRVYACDLHAHRVELIRASAVRLGHDTIKPRVQDAAKFVPDWEGSMDAVLCDVPCSGLGVIAAKPDIKLNITQDELEKLPEIQAAILDNCARYVRRGGTLVYSTCTILKSENQDVVNAFLKKHPEFKLCDVKAYVPECFNAGIEDGMLTLLGCRDDVDGFFMARMERR